jgi:hypothetical protein
MATDRKLMGILEIGDRVLCENGETAVITEMDSANWGLNSVCITAKNDLDGEMESFSPSFIVRIIEETGE